MRHFSIGMHLNHTVLAHFCCFSTGLRNVPCTMTKGFPLQLMQLYSARLQPSFGPPVKQHGLSTISFLNGQKMLSWEEAIGFYCLCKTKTIVEIQANNWRVKKVESVGLFKHHGTGTSHKSVKRPFGHKYHQHKVWGPSSTSEMPQLSFGFEPMTF